MSLFKFPKQLTKVNFVYLKGVTASLGTQLSKIHPQTVKRPFTQWSVTGLTSPNYRLLQASKALAKLAKLE